MQLASGEPPAFALYIYILFYTCLEWFSIRIRRDKVAAQVGLEKLQVLVILVVPQKGRPCEK